MRKTKLLTCLSLCVLLTTTACSCNNNANLKENESETESTIEETKEINKDVDINLETKEGETLDIQDPDKNSNVDYSQITFGENQYDAGEVEVSDYKGMSQPFEKETLTEEMITSKLQGYYDSVSQEVLVTSGTADWNQKVNVTFVATDYDNGNFINQSGSNGTVLVLGRYTFYDAMDDDIVGMKVGEHKEYAVDYGMPVNQMTNEYTENADLVSRRVKYEVTLNGIYQDRPLTETAGTDAFVRTYLSESTGCNTVAELTAYATDEVERELQDAYEAQVASSLLTQLIKDSDITEYSTELKDAYYTYFYDLYVNNAREENVSLPEFCALIATTPTNLEKRLQQKAENCAKADTILTEIAKQEGLESKEAALQYIIANAELNKTSQQKKLSEFYDFQYRNITN